MMTDEQAVRLKIAEILHTPVETIQETMRLTDLVTDSILLVHMVIELQEVFGVRFVHEEVQEVETVGDLLALVACKQAR